MKRFQIGLALVVALATSIGLRAATHHWRWAGRPNGFFGTRPGHWGGGRAGCWGGPAAPAAGVPLAPAPGAPLVPPQLPE